MEGYGGSSNNLILYTESIRAGRSVRLFVSIIYITIVAISVTMALIDSQFILMSAIAVFSITVVFLFLYSNFRVLRVLISETHLEVSYGRFHQKIIPFAKISECEHIQISFREYRGIGIRLGRDGTWAYNTSLGDAIKVIITDERPFAFSTANPERVCELLQGLLG